MVCWVDLKCRCQMFCFGSIFSYILLKRKCGGWGDGSMGLLCKHKDLGLNRQNPSNKPGTVTCMSVSLALGGSGPKVEDLWGLLALTSPAQVSMKVPVSRDTGYTTSSPGSAHMHGLLHTHMQLHYIHTWDTQNNKNKGKLCTVLWLNLIC